MKTGVQFKIAAGYTLAILVLALAVWLVYGNTRAFMQIDKAEREFMERRDVVDSLIYCFLETDNCERSLCLGNTDELDNFDASLRKTMALADSLKAMVSDSSQCLKIDSLRSMLLLKRENTLMIVDEMARNNPDKFFREKVIKLQEGQDSVVIHPKSVEVQENKEVVYDIVKSKKGFFARLADAFRKQHADTIQVSNRSRKAVTDSARHSINIADTVAGVLKEIKREELKARRARQEQLDEKRQTQQLVGVQLARRIEQILDNIISNALKYTDQGSIAISARMQGSRLQVDVADTGRGMTPEEARRIFNAFTRLPGAQGTEGVGLGLSIARELATLLGGRITLESAKGKGTTFHVSLPLEFNGNGMQGDETAAAESRPAGAGRKPGHRPEGMTADRISILIVDDDRLQLQLLREMLTGISGGRWHITACSHADEALRQLADLRPHVFFIDIEMPEMSGTEMAARIAGRYDTLLIAMTAHEPSIEPRLLEAGFDACLFKPFNTDRLCATLQSATGIELDCGKTAAEKPDADGCGGTDEDGNGDECRTDKAPDATGDDGGCKAGGHDFGAVTEFAAGDNEACREILSSFMTEIDGHMSTLDKAKAGPDRTAISRVAHKALPMLTMIGARSVDELKALSPEHIGSVTDADMAEMCEKIAGEMRQIRRELDEKIKALG